MLVLEYFDEALKFAEFRLCEFLSKGYKMDAPELENLPPVRLDAPRSLQPDSYIRKTCAYTLLRLLAHPRSAHLEVSC